MTMPAGLFRSNFVRPALPGFIGGSTELTAPDAASVLPAVAPVAMPEIVTARGDGARVGPFEPTIAQYSDMLAGTRALLGAPLAEKRELSAAMLARLNLAWTVSEHPAAAIVDGQSLPVPGYKTLRRDDNGDFLSIVGEGYGVVQNSEAFESIDSIVADGGGEYVGAWVFNGGRQVCLRMKLSTGGEVVSGDALIPTLVLRTGHGQRGGSVSGSLQVMRKVCLNGLTVREDLGIFTVRHTRNARGRVRISQGDVRKVFAAAADRIETFKAMAKVVMSAAEMRQWIEGVIPFPSLKDDGSERARARANVDRMHREIMGLVETGMGADIPGVRGTLWGVYNAVTEHVDHVRAQRAQLDQRLYLTTFGAGADVKADAFDAAVAALRRH